MNGYAEFLAERAQHASGAGFSPAFLPDFLFDFQGELTSWAIERGRSLIAADCGMGKTPMQLVWAENVVRHTNKPVLVATPLAVSYQTVEEAEKFGIEAVRSPDGKVSGPGIVVTNYQRLHYFNPDDFGGMVLDESSILKNFNGATRAAVTEFMRRLPYRLLCTATAAPNDYIELGTSSEALGELGYMDMLSRFFRNDQSHANNRGRMHGKASQWRFKGHAEEPFWRWVSSWARAIRKPSDYGYEDNGFALPPLSEVEHVVKAKTVRDGWLFDTPAVTLQEQREERRRTIPERCAKAADLADHGEQVLVWCHLNAEGDWLTDAIPGAVQVSGSDSDEAKEERLMAFAHGQIRVLVTKPKIGAWGLNLQNCSHTITFPSHSYEQYYQSVRRFWRFGQKRPVTVDIVLSEGEERILQNLQRKSTQADRMFDALLVHMQDAVSIRETNPFTRKATIPSWL